MEVVTYTDTVEVFVTVVAGHVDFRYCASRNVLCTGSRNVPIQIVVGVNLVALQRHVRHQVTEPAGERNVVGGLLLVGFTHFLVGGFCHTALIAQLGRDSGTGKGVGHRVTVKGSGKIPQTRICGIGSHVVKVVVGRVA